MLNFLLKEVQTWFDMFINFNYSFLFLLSITSTLVPVFLSRNSINFFSSIYLFLIVLLIFLFCFNLGPLAGFLFLCETTSLFFIFIILGKVFNNNNVKKKNIKFIGIFSALFLVILYFCLLKISVVQKQTQFMMFFMAENATANDFLVLFYLFFQNVYLCFTMIMVFLVILSYFIICGALLLSKINKILKNKLGLALFFRLILTTYFSNNNNIKTSLKNFLNFFKKLC